MRAPRRSFRFLAPVAMAVVVAVSAGACSTAGTYAARVNGKTISEDTLIDELRAIASNTQYLEQIQRRSPVLGIGQGTFDSTFTAAALTRRIYFVLIEAELAERKLVITQEQLDNARQTMAAQVGGDEILSKFSPEYQAELVAEQAEIDLLAIASSGIGTPETAERAYYEQHPEEFQSACASHILVADEAKALDLRTRLAEGADFSELAMAESTDTETAAQGGSVGCDLKRSSPVVAPLLDAIFTQVVGEVGAPIGTGSGFHLIKVTSRGLDPFEEHQTAIREVLLEIGVENMRTLLQTKMQEAKIDINPKYGTFDSTGENPGVVPPQGGSASTTAPAGTPTAP